MRRAKRRHENLEWNLTLHTSSALIRQWKYKTSWLKYRVVANVGCVVRSIVSEQDSCNKSGYGARCNRIRQRAGDISACHQLAGDGIVLFQILLVFPSSFYGNRRHGLLVYLLLFCVWFNDSPGNSDYVASSDRAVVSNELERMRIPFFWNMELCPRRSYWYLMVNTFLSSDRMVSAARNPTHELAQDLAAKDSLLLLILKPLAHYTHQSKCCMFSVCVQW